MENGEKLKSIVKNNKRLWYKVECIAVDIATLTVMCVIVVKLIGA